MIRFSKILFPTDFSKDSDSLFDYAVYFARLHNGKLFILHVISEDRASSCLIPSFEVGPVPEMEFQLAIETAEGEEGLRRKMLDFVERSKKEGLLVEDLFASGKPHAEILRICTEREIDLIVMGNHPKSDMERRLLGGTIEKVVHKATCPVFIARRTVPVSEAVHLT